MQHKTTHFKVDQKVLVPNAVCKNCLCWHTSVDVASVTCFTVQAVTVQSAFTITVYLVVFARTLHHSANCLVTGSVTLWKLEYKWKITDTINWDWKFLISAEYLNLHFERAEKKLVESFRSSKCNCKTWAKPKKNLSEVRTFTYPSEDYWRLLEHSFSELVWRAFERINSMYFICDQHSQQYK